MTEHEITIEKGTEPESMGFRDWRQPVCTCGWKGRKHRNYENYAFTNCNKEGKDHLFEARKKSVEKT